MIKHQSELFSRLTKLMQGIDEICLPIHLLENELHDITRGKPGYERDQFIRELCDIRDNAGHLMKLRIFIRRFDYWYIHIMQESFARNYIGMPILPRSEPGIEIRDHRHYESSIPKQHWANGL